MFQQKKVINSSKNKIIILFLFLTTWLIANSQTQDPLFDQIFGSKEFYLSRLEIKNKYLEQEIDSIIIDTDCPKLKNPKYKYFLVIGQKINKDKFKFIFWLSESPKAPLIKNGYYEYNGYSLLFDGNFPRDLFLKTKSKRKFIEQSIKSLDGEPNWNFLYYMNEISLINYDCW